MNEQPIIENITCSCGTAFQWEKFETELGEKFNSMFRPKLCDPCQDQVNAENQLKRNHQEAQERAEIVRRTKDSLGDRTPARYRATDTAHPAFNVKLWQRIQKWRPTPEAPWLGLVDESGASKTRCAFLLLHDIVVESVNSSKKGRARSFEVATSYELAEAIRNQYGKGDDSAKARAFIDGMRRVSILLLDDLGKAKNTEAVSAELFAILDRRHAENLATIWTANSSPNEIVTGMSADLAGPLAGRLIECSQIVTA
jgi:chromosomal replication initiation ATPase DnaA